MVHWEQMGLYLLNYAMTKTCNNADVIVILKSFLGIIKASFVIKPVDMFSYFFADNSRKITASTNFFEVTENKLK